MTNSNNKVIKSVNDNQHQILLDIMKIYGINEITLDFTYSCGNFYKPSKDKDGDTICVPQPKYKMDVCPQTEDTVKIEKMGKIPLKDSSCKCIVYDPPFVIAPQEAPSMTTNKKDGSNVIQKRFASFYPVSELIETYWFHMNEMYRLLEDDGFAIIKCQPTVSSRKQVNSPEWLWLCGESVGLDMIDKFVLTANTRLISGKHKKQEHSRRFESYFLVFKKSQKQKTKYICNEEIKNGIIEGFVKNNIVNKKISKKLQ